MVPKHPAWTGLVVSLSWAAVIAKIVYALRVKVVAKRTVPALNDTINVTHTLVAD
jgi:hypothetical protein